MTPLLLLVVGFTNIRAAFQFDGRSGGVFKAIASSRRTKQKPLPAQPLARARTRTKIAIPPHVATRPTPFSAPTLGQEYF